MKRIFVLRSEDIRRRCQEAVLDCPDGYQVTIKEPVRSLDANAAQWPYLEGFSKKK